MALLIGLIGSGVLAVLLALGFLVKRHLANQAAPWPDENPKDDEAARQNILRALTVGMVAFVLVVAMLSAEFGWALKVLPLAAVSLIAVVVVRMRTRARDLSTGKEQSGW